MILDIAFWGLVSLVVYVYAGYPLLLAVVTGRDRRVPVSAEDKHVPKVTLLISAYNEARCIAEKLENTLSLDYAPEALQVLVVSDASDDGTDEIVARYAARGIELLRMPQRGGKTVGLNAGVAHAAGEIIVFSDANALYQRQALRRLAAPFADQRVGAVIGESSYIEPESASGESESLYWRYETWIKRMESRRGSVVGGDGAIYAVRRELYQPMSPDALSDFVNPLQVVRAGYRCVYEPLAVSYEATAEDFAREYRRKVRIVNRAWRALWAMREMLNPFRHGYFAVKLWSHKVLRWWVPAGLAMLLVLNIVLAKNHLVYQLTLGAQLALYGMAIAGFVMRGSARQPVFLRVPFYFCLVNVAAAVGLLEAMEGKSYTTWATARAEG